MNPFELTKLIRTMDETEPLIHGSVMGNNPVIRDHRSKYADFKWIHLKNWLYSMWHTVCPTHCLQQYNTDNYCGTIRCATIR